MAAPELVPAPVPAPIVLAGPKREAGAAPAGAGLGLGLGLGVGGGREKEVPRPNLNTAPAVALLSRGEPLPAVAGGSTGTSPAGKPDVRLKEGKGLPSGEANGESDATVAQRGVAGGRVEEVSATGPAQVTGDDECLVGVRVPSW